MVYNGILSYISDMQSGIKHREITKGCLSRALLYSQLSGIIFGISENIPEMEPDDRQAPFLGPSGTILGSSGTSFGIIWHQFWDLTLFFGV